MTKALASEVVLQMTATDLAWLAETADGNRDVDFILVRDAEGKPQLRTALKEGDEMATEIRVKSEPILRDRTRVVQVTCQVAGHELQPLLSDEGWDALFWTESAVEKFLYPYYRSQRLWDKRMDDLKAKYESDTDAVAIAHRASSNSLVLDANSIGVGKVVRSKTAAATPAVQWKRLGHYLAEE